MADKSVLQLQQPLKDGGIRSVNFFNGRLLSGKDFSSEQAARREADARLGLALGDGVAFGLEVARDTELDKPAAPVLRIQAGLALNRRGQTLRLLGETSVALARAFDADAEGCVFANCMPLAGGTYVAGAGVYLLTIAPAQFNDGRAASNGLDPGTVACNTDAVIEAVQFRLIAVNRARYAALDPASPQFRNRLAYLCFGVEARAAAAADPWRADAARYGLGGGQRGQGLPGPAFVARRRRLAEAQAMCAQFQQHLGDLLAASAAPASESAASVFRYLPPFGTVPLALTPLRGFVESVFFSGIPRPPAPGSNTLTRFIDARQLGQLQQLALALAPTDTASGEYLRVYRPWQNVRAMHDGQAVQPVLVFASGLLPELALARFDLTRFDYGNFAAAGGSA
jgi:hypothetical protein